MLDTYWHAYVKKNLSECHAIVNIIIYKLLKGTRKVFLTYIKVNLTCTFLFFIYENIDNSVAEMVS